MWRRTVDPNKQQITVAASAATPRKEPRTKRERETNPDGARGRLSLLGDGALRPVAGRSLRRMRLAPHRASTVHLQSLYPWQADAGIGALGPLVGHNVLGGGSFCFDPWEWYDAGLITNPNGITFGEIGSRKSTELKTRIVRSYEFGRGTFGTDVKSEYNELAEFLGHEPIWIGPGRPDRLNPFDIGTGEDPATAQSRQLTMLQALASGVLRRDLTESERTLCRIAVAELTGGYLERDITATGQQIMAPRPGDRPRVPVLPEVIEAMQHPSAAAMKDLPLSPEELKSNTADLIMAFQRLVTGDLAGMFDGPTTADVDPRTKLLIVNISSVLADRPDALPLVRICASAWLQSAITTHRMRRYHISDEAWADMSVGTLRWYQSMFKLARQNLVSNWLVLHKPADLLTAGAGESEMDRVAKSLIADAGVVCFYRQKPQQIATCKEMFGITDAQAAWLTRLPPGQALWWAGQDRSFLVQHVRSETEKKFTNTDQAPEPASADAVEDLVAEGAEADGESGSVPVDAAAADASTDAEGVYVL